MRFQRFHGELELPAVRRISFRAGREQYHSLFGTLYAKTMLDALGEQKTLSEIRQMGALAAPYPFVLYSDLYDIEKLG